MSVLSKAYMYDEAAAFAHVEAMLSHYGAHLGLRNARKHVGWYLESSGAATATVKAWRKRLCTEESPAALLAGLAEFYAGPARDNRSPDAEELAA